MVTEALIQACTLENMLFAADNRRLRDDASFLEEGIAGTRDVLEPAVFMEDEEIVSEAFDSVERLARCVRQKQLVFAGWHSVPRTGIKRVASLTPTPGPDSCAKSGNSTSRWAG